MLKLQNVGNDKKKDSKSKRLFKKRLIKSVVYLIIGLVITFILAFIQNPTFENFLIQPLPGIAIIVLFLFLWLSIKSIIDAYTFYLFARILEVFKRTSTIEKTDLSTIRQMPSYPQPTTTVSPIKKEEVPQIKHVPILPSRKEQVIQTPSKQLSSKEKSGKKTCPYCGRELPYGDIHIICPYCGHRLK